MSITNIKKKFLLITLAEINKFEPPKLEHELLDLPIREILKNSLYCFEFYYRIEKVFNLPPIPYKTNNEELNFGITLRNLINYIDPINPIQTTQLHIKYNIKYLEAQFTKSALEGLIINNTYLYISDSYKKLLVCH